MVAGPLPYNHGQPHFARVRRIVTGNVERGCVSEVLFISNIVSAVLRRRISGSSPAAAVKRRRCPLRRPTEEEARRVNAVKGIAAVDVETIVRHQVQEPPETHRRVVDYTAARSPSSSSFSRSIRQQSLRWLFLFERAS